MTNKKIWIGVIVISLTLIGVIANAIASKGSGSAPVNATPLEDNIVTGMLPAGEDIWYKFTPIQSDTSKQSHVNLALVFSPSDAGRSKLVALEIYSTDQVARWYSGASDQLEPLGVGTIVSRDDDPETGELVWQEWIIPNETYYVHIANGTDISLDYWLLTTINDGRDEESIQQAEDTAAPPPPPSALLSSTDPGHALPLVMGINQGDLAPDGERWFSVTLEDTNDYFGENLILLLVFTPGKNANWVHRVHMDIYPGHYLLKWTSDDEQLPNIGAGSLVSRDGDPNTGELIWNGWLNDHETYYIRLRNDNSIPIDYWLFTEDIFHPQLGDLVVTPAEAAVSATPHPPPDLPETGGPSLLPTEPVVDATVDAISQPAL